MLLVYHAKAMRQWSEWNNAEQHWRFGPISVTQALNSQCLRLYEEILGNLSKSSFPTHPVPGKGWALSRATGGNLDGAGRGRGPIALSALQPRGHAERCRSVSPRRRADSFNSRFRDELLDREEFENLPDARAGPLWHTVSNLGLADSIAGVGWISTTRLAGAPIRAILRPYPSVGKVRG
jgi:hypothetical protein